MSLFEKVPDLDGIVDRTRLPGHVGIIMDGNGRWAKERGYSRLKGHRAGVERLHDIVAATSDLGIPVPDYVEENVSTKVVKIIQSYTGVVDKMVWRKS